LPENVSFQAGTLAHDLAQWHIGDAGWQRSAFSLKRDCVIFSRVFLVSFHYADEEWRM